MALSFETSRRGTRNIDIYSGILLGKSLCELTGMLAQGKEGGGWRLTMPVKYVWSL